MLLLQYQGSFPAYCLKENMIAKVKDKHVQPGILATLHKSGNSLNFNPHVHLIGTSELVDTKLGEITKIDFLPYKKICYIWKKAFLSHLLKKKIITTEEFDAFCESYKKGFHVYFQAISGTENEVLFRTAEYIATGFFHNSQIMEVDNHKKTITFRYKKFMDRHTGKKYYAIKTMDIYEFMAKILFFLPDKNKKMIRYYGIYASNVDNKLKEIKRDTWAMAVENSFESKPELCPECGTAMIKDVVYSFYADKALKSLIKTHRIIKGAGCFLPSMAHPGISSSMSVILPAV